MGYRPRETFCTPIELLNPLRYESVKGVNRPVYPDTGEIILCSFKSYGGTETTINGVFTVVDTAVIELWYRPDVTSASRVKLGSEIYEVMGKPEDIEQRHQFLKLKVRGVNGGT